MSIARDISRQTSRQTVTLTASQTAVTVTGGFSGSSLETYLNGARLIQGSDYTLNGTSGITLTQGASAGDIIEFSIRNTSNSGLSAVNTSEVVDEAITYDKLSNSSTDDLNLQKRVAQAWVNFSGATNPPTVRNSYNVSSVNDVGTTGDYEINFDTNMANATYCVSIDVYHYAGVTWTVTPSIHTLSTDKVRIIIGRDGSNVYDPSLCTVIIFGEKS